MGAFIPKIHPPHLIRLRDPIIKCASSGELFKVVKSHKLSGNLKVKGTCCVNSPAGVLGRFFEPFFACYTAHRLALQSKCSHRGDCVLDGFLKFCAKELQN